MGKPEMEDEVRARLLDAIDDRLALYTAKAANHDDVGFWDGRLSGLNDAYRYIATGEWET
jgi:hypothetical protein